MKTMPGQINILNYLKNREIVVDNFAGGGGASEGIEIAIGRCVDIAINHDPAAILMHKVNHPGTEHYLESVWDVDPIKAVRGRPVALAWFSPDCKHFSKAKGGKPVEKSIRGLAWVAVKWADTVKPRVIILENVEEFQTWGPLKKDEQGNLYPDQKRKGQTFNSFKNALKKLGYEVEHRELVACDYGAPTTRKRFFLIARRDGQPIVWPDATRGKGKLPYVAASSIIDWSIQTPSIFDRKIPLAENSMIRIARGIQKFIFDEEPYIVKDSAYFLTHYYTHQGKEVRGSTLKEPLATITTANRFGLVKVNLQDVNLPTKENVYAFLIKYYGCGIGQTINNPLDTITTKDRFGLVTVKGKDYKIEDIGLRMLTPRELFNGQGFRKTYIINKDYKGNAYPKAAQVARCGNSVPPPFAEALVRANLPELCKEIKPMREAK